MHAIALLLGSYLSKQQRQEKTGNVQQPESLVCDKQDWSWKEVKIEL